MRPLSPAPAGDPMAHLPTFRHGCGQQAAASPLTYRQERGTGRSMPTGIPYHPNDDDRNMLEAGLFFGVPLKGIARFIGVTIPTLKRHYGDVIQRAQLKRGPKPHVPNDLEKELVMKAAAVGVPYAGIASLLHMSKGSLQRYFPEELSHGRARANFAVGNKVFEIATGDPTHSNTVIAAIWWTKARMGW
jgi:hypothetical protein